MITFQDDFERKLWIGMNRDLLLVMSTLEEMEAPMGRAVLAQFMLRLMDQDPTSLHVFIEMLEAEL